MKLSIVSPVNALGESGIDAAWASYKTLFPLILGTIGLGVFFLYEPKVSKEPMVPFELVSNRTSALGYACAFLHVLVSTCTTYHFLVYHQGAGAPEPLQLGVGVFGVAFTVAPTAISSGFIVVYFGTYRLINFVDWIFTVLGFGVLSLLRAVSHKIWQTEVIGFGLGILYAAPTYAIMAAQPVCMSASSPAM
ncbi:hypothetical protein FRB94_012765 [Tulasnella sp. JGI-2019a]|nr:hypothetical protein FRB94_012765 [Tulasnella sp. JGI-2019a]